MIMMKLSSHLTSVLNSLQGATSHLAHLGARRAALQIQAIGASLGRAARLGSPSPLRHPPSRPRRHLGRLKTNHVAFNHHHYSASSSRKIPILPYIREGGDWRGIGARERERA